MKNKKISWNEFLILIASKEHAEGRHPIHYKVFYPIAKLYEGDDRLNFSIIDEEIKGHKGQIKYQRTIRTVIYNSTKDILGDNWIFNKTNVEKDGFYDFNLDYFNPRYEEFFGSLYDDFNDRSEEVKINYEYQYKTYLSKQRDNYLQRKFADEVKEKWGNTCAFCNVKIRELIEGAHIFDKKDGEDNNFFNPENGVALCKNCHKLFDSHFIKINPDNLKIYLRDELEKDYFVKLNPELALPNIDKEMFKGFIKSRNIKNDK